MKFKITFENIIIAENMDEAEEKFMQYIKECAELDDIDMFLFTEIKKKKR